MHDATGCQAAINISMYLSNNDEGFRKFNKGTAATENATLVGLRSGYASPTQGGASITYIEGIRVRSAASATRPLADG